jgi:hypothetical protein
MKKYLLSFILIISVNYLFAQSGSSTFKEVKLFGVPKPMAPANLVISDLVFTDSRGNLNFALDANETAEITFSLKNEGQGDAYRVKVNIVDSANIKGVSFLKEIVIGTLPAGETHNFVIPITGTVELQTAETNFGIKVTEGNHFDPETVSIAFKTNEFKRPILSIVDSKFEGANDEAKVTKGKIVKLTVLVQNKGVGDAKNVSVEFVNPLNVSAYSNTNKFNFPEIKSNETREITYQFFTNNSYNEAQVPIIIKIAENYNKVVVSETKSIDMDLTSSSIAGANKVKVQDIRQDQKVISNYSLVSDVDRNIPISANKYKNRIALIIGNEDYSSFQTGLAKEVDVDYAKNDAKIFKEYCEKTLGVVPENINMLLNASAIKMKQSIDKVNKLMKNLEGDVEVIFYYAGHGLPDEATKEAYLIPVDVTGSNLQSGIKLQEVYKSFSEYPSKGVTMFIDACFSGGARGEQMVKARGVKIVPKPDYLEGNIVSFTASSGNQSSNAYAEKKHGMFTYFLLKELQTTKGELSYKDFWDGIRKNVSVESIKVNDKEQEPQRIIGALAKDTWMNKKFVY